MQNKQILRRSELTSPLIFKTWERKTNWAKSKEKVSCEPNGNKPRSRDF